MEEKEVQKGKKMNQMSKPSPKHKTQVPCMWRTSQRAWRASRLAHSCDGRHTWCDERHTIPLHFWRKERLRDVERWGSVEPYIHAMLLCTLKTFLAAEAVTQAYINSHLQNQKGFRSFSTFFPLPFSLLHIFFSSNLTLLFLYYFYEFYIISLAISIFLYPF